MRLIRISFGALLAGGLMLATAMLAPLALAAQAGPVPARAADLAPVQLIMVDQQGCYYCAKWEAEIGRDYPAAPQAAFAPLLRVDIDGPWPNGVALARRPYITPTFILLKDGQEAARIEGYPGKAHFWPLIDEMLQKTGVVGAAPKSKAKS